MSFNYALNISPWYDFLAENLSFFDGIGAITAICCI